MKYVVILFVAIGCADREPSFCVGKANQAIRREIFMNCLKAVPRGPTHTKYNDWDEVVDACENAAYYQSISTDHCKEKP